MMKNYFIYTYGCQMNESDSERLACQLEDVGYEETKEVKSADLILLNTCCVRETAENKIYGKIGELTHLKKANKELIIAVTGCMAQKNQAELFKRAPHIDIVLGTHNIGHINEMVEEVKQTKQHQIMTEMDNTTLTELPAKNKGAFSAWVPIMNGCNKFCTYCIVPYVRGREISRSIDAIRQDIVELGKEGIKEITLLGQNVNSYGLDFKDGTDFGTLITALDGIPGIERIRYMTSHPQDMTKSMIDAIGQSSNVVSHLHLPIQSGSDRILKIMNRRYTVEHYKDLISYCREKIANLTLTTDIIVGFPGETEEDFNETLQLLKDIRYDMAYTFIYSPRSGTPAATMENQVSEEIKRVRLQQLMDIQNQISLELNQKLVGEKEEIIIEGPSRNDENTWFGRTRGNKMVLFPKPENIAIGATMQAIVEKGQTWILKGHLCKE